MLSSVTETPGGDLTRSGGVSVDVLVAAVCFVVSAGLVGASARLPQEPPSAMALLGWPPFALAGGIVMDQRPTAPLGRVLTVLGLVPVLHTAWVAARFGGWLTSSPDVARSVTELAAVQAAAVAIALPWAFRPPQSRRQGGVLVVLAAVGALVVLFSETGLVRSEVGRAGWVVVALACAGVWWQVVRGVRHDDRASRRRVTWLLVTLGLSATVTATAWSLFSIDVACYTTGFTLTATAVVATRLSFVTDFRPLDEHVLDLVVVVGAIGAAALVGLLVRLGSGWTRLPSPTTSAVFSALITAMMAAPAALWVRQRALARRYGSGIIAPSDVADITADLHAQTEPRDLLDKAARMVATASGSGQARIVLGVDAPVVPEHWLLHPLVVGSDRVGALIVESGNPDGPELRQQKTVAQLLPTVALVARAVGLAIEAEHARRDVARERDAERRRILSDLHDGLGPVLAGMSMRVRAALRTAPSPQYAGLLADLAAGLADGRTDLRRIVAGITPSALEDGDLEAALDRLVESFQGVDGGPRILLDVAVDAVLTSAVKVAAYRSVAEGVTNALRHAGATSIDVRVGSVRGVVLVDVVDDGRSGVIVPGVGLSSLAQRAQSLGGCLELSAATPKGTHMHVELPAAEQART